MYAIPITVDNGVLKLPPDTILPADARLAILVLDDDLHPNDDIDTPEFTRMVLTNPAYDFLYDEPDIYTDDDILPGRENPNFRRA